MINELMWNLGSIFGMIGELAACVLLLVLLLAGMYAVGKVLGRLTLRK